MKLIVLASCHCIMHALQNGASIEVIENLLALNKGATDVRNMFGQTPLHLLFYDNAFVPKSCYGQKEQKYVLKIINKFYAIMPSAMLVDDMEERIILECVIEKEFDYRSVRKVQRLTRSATSFMLNSTLKLTSIKL